MKLAYIDSSIHIALFEGIPSYQAALSQQMIQLAQRGWMSCISEVVMLEPLQNGQDILTQQYRKLFDTLRVFENYPLLFADALRIMQAERLKIIDALHVAIAAHYDCQLFVSSDPHFRSLKTIRPYWIDLSDSAPSVGVIER